MPRNNPRFLALLRGINVGGKNIISKAALRQCFEDIGLTNVRTYIQSGNILFGSEETRISELTSLIEAGLSKRFSYQAQAVVLSRRKYKSALAAAPVGWGADPEQKHNAMFLLGGTSAKKVLSQLPSPKPEIETVTAAPGVIFWSVSKAQQTKTTLMRLAKEPVYQQMTVRNHNTVLRLGEMFDEGA